MTDDNKRNMRTLEYHEADAMTLAYALLIQGTRLWMSGNSRALERMDSYRKQFEAVVPEAARVFDDGTWCEIAIALQGTKSFSLDLVPRSSADKHVSSYSGGKLKLVLVPGENAVLVPPQITGLPAKRSYEWEFESDKTDIKPGDETTKAVFDVLVELAPLGCEATMDDKADEAPRYRW